MTAARNQALATQARRVYLEALVRGMTPLVAAIGQGATQLLSHGAGHGVMQARRDAVQAWQRFGPNWLIDDYDGMKGEMEKAEPGSYAAF